MANITAAMVKDLREKTGAGMMDCKTALGETSGDMEAAVDWLRKKGLSKAAKKAGRVAAEGLIGLMLAPKKGAMVEVNSETDFVARNDHFQGLVKMIADVALNNGEDVEAIKAAKAGTMTIADAISVGDRDHRREHHAAPRGRAFGRAGRGCGLRAQPGFRGPRQDRRAGRARIRRATPRNSRPSAGRSRCILRRRTRSRSMPPASIPRS